MILAFGADHAGFHLKSHLIDVSRASGHVVLDLGTDSVQSVDYPDFGEAVARAVLDGRADLGVVICSNGVGISIAANKVPGIRCALCHSAWGAARARQHTDANVLALGALEVGTAVAEEVLAAFVSSEFEGGRHSRRLAKLMEIEQRANAPELARV
jgi:ribose 5-phosphate isomerase B